VGKEYGGGGWKKKLLSAWSRFVSLLNSAVTETKGEGSKNRKEALSFDICLEKFVPGSSKSYGLKKKGNTKLAKNGTGN